MLKLFYAQLLEANILHSICMHTPLLCMTYMIDSSKYRMLSNFISINHSYLLEVVWEALEVLYGSDAGTVLGKLVESSLELIQGRYSEAEG